MADNVVPFPTQNTAPQQPTNVTLKVGGRGKIEEPRDPNQK